MTIATALKHMLAAGMPHDAIVAAVAEMEAECVQAAPTRSKGALRQARYEERQRQKASESVSPDASGISPDAHPLPLPPSPQTPQPPTPTPGESSIARKGPTSVDVARGFLAFWAAYPKRAGKDAAAKAFAKAMARIGGDDPLATIMAGIERALPGWDDPQFIPHPATWLNQGRWEDDAPAPRTETRHDRPDHRLTARPAHAQPSRTERDQSAALEVLARRGLLPGPDQGGRVHDRSDPGLAAA